MLLVFYFNLVEVGSVKSIPPSREIWMVIKFMAFISSVINYVNFMLLVFNSNLVEFGSVKSIPPSRKAWMLINFMASFSVFMFDLPGSGRHTEGKEVAISVRVHFFLISVLPLSCLS